MRNWICSAVFLVCALAAPAQVSSSQCVKWKATHVRKSGTGWDVSLVDFHRRSGERPLHGRLEHVVRTDYSTVADLFLYTEALVDPCQHEVGLRTLFLQVTRAWGLALNGKTFAVTLSREIGEMQEGRRVPWGGITEITLIDTTGTGKFDLLEYGMVPDSIPAWTNASKKP